MLSFSFNFACISILQSTPNPSLFSPASSRSTVFSKESSTLKTSGPASRNPIDERRIAKFTCISPRRRM